MFSSPVLGKGSRFLSPVLGKGSVGCPVQFWEKGSWFPKPVLGKVPGSPVYYWENILDFPVHAVLGKGSMCSQVQYWEKFCVLQSITGKLSWIAQYMQYWKKVLYVPQSCTGKRVYRFLSPILGKGSIGPPVQYWEKVLGSLVQYWKRF